MFEQRACRLLFLFIEHEKRHNTEARHAETGPGSAPALCGRSGDQICCQAVPGEENNLLAGHPALFLGIGAMAVSAVCVMAALKYIRIDSPGERFMLALILGGALGNAADRLLMGSVTDYIRVRLFSFPVFNFADVCIVLGVCALSIRILRPDAPAMKEKRQNE